MSDPPHPELQDSVRWIAGGLDSDGHTLVGAPRIDHRPTTVRDVGIGTVAGDEDPEKLLAALIARTIGARR